MGHTGQASGGATSAKLSVLCPDVTVGSWMLAFNVTHLDDRRLCQVRSCPQNSSPPAPITCISCWPGEGLDMDSLLEQAVSGCLDQNHAGMHSPAAAFPAVCTQSSCVPRGSS